MSNFESMIITYASYAYLISGAKLHFVFQFFADVAKFAKFGCRHNNNVACLSSVSRECCSKTTGQDLAVFAEMFHLSDNFYDKTRKGFLEWGGSDFLRGAIRCESKKTTIFLVYNFTEFWPIF